MPRHKPEFDRRVYLDLFRASADGTPALLTVEEFTQRYYPQYARAYEAPRGIRLRKDGRPFMSTPASIQAQITKRQNRVATYYAQYVALRRAMFPETVRATLEHAAPQYITPEDKALPDNEFFEIVAQRIQEDSTTT